MNISGTFFLIYRFYLQFSPHYYAPLKLNSANVFLIIQAILLKALLSVTIVVLHLIDAPKRRLYKLLLECIFRRCFHRLSDIQTLIYKKLAAMRNNGNRRVIIFTYCIVYCLLYIFCTIILHFA